MNKKRARILIADEYHDTALESLRTHDPFEAEAERNPVLMHYVSSAKGWEAIEIGVLEKAAATPRKFAAFAKVVDDLWHTEGAINGSNLRAAVHTAAYRLKTQYEGILGQIPAQAQERAAKLKSELRRAIEAHYSAVAEVSRLRHAKLDSRAQEERLSRADASQAAATQKFANANPPLDPALVETVKALVRVEMIIAAMRFTGPPKRLRPPDGQAGDGNVTADGPPGQTKTAEAQQGKPDEVPGGVSEGSVKSAKKSNKQNRPKVPGQSKPQIEAAPSGNTQADLLLNGKTAELVWEGTPGYVITFKVPSDLSAEMRGLGLILVDYRLNDQKLQRYWAKDPDLVERAVVMVEQHKPV